MSGRSDDRRHADREGDAVARYVADELLSLWHMLPAALAQDLVVSDVKTSGTKGSTASPSPVNAEVSEVLTLIEVDVWELGSEIAGRLGIRWSQPDAPRTVAAVIDALPQWRVGVASRDPELAASITRALETWCAKARQAMGLHLRDSVLQVLCPDHRGTKPTRLRKLGNRSVVHPTLLAGPPPEALRPTLTGPLCDWPGVDCPHQSCTEIRTGGAGRIVTDAGRPTDWVRRGDGTVAWLSEDGAPGVTWAETGTLRCPTCARQWSKLWEKRLLAVQLADLGDSLPTGAA